MDHSLNIINCLFSKERTVSYPTQSKLLSGEYLTNVIPLACLIFLLLSIARDSGLNSNNDPFEQPMAPLRPSLDILRVQAGKSISVFFFNCFLLISQIARILSSPTVQANSYVGCVVRPHNSPSLCPYNKVLVLFSLTE